MPFISSPKTTPNLSVASRSFNKHDFEPYEAFAAFHIRNIAAASGLPPRDVDRLVRLRMQQLMDELGIEERVFLPREDINDTWEQ